MKELLLAATLLGLGLSISVNAKAWRSIVPLHSTRADVEQLLGKPNGKYGRYELENEWVEIFYSTGRCVNGWNVPADTVIDISVSPTRPLRISDLKIDLSKYDRFRDPHTSHVYYTHRSDGIRYVVVEPEGEINGKVLTTYYESTLEDERLLYCRKLPNSTKDWRGMIPLKSTRAEVERLLSHPTGPLPTYYLSDSTVTFWYSHCRCGDKCKDDDWNVPPDTVTGIYVDLKGIVRLADLGLDLSQFKKSRLADDVPGSFIYSNAKEGFAIEGGGEYASALIYGPHAEDNYLRCSNKPSQSPKPKRNCRLVQPTRRLGPSR